VKAAGGKAYSTGALALLWQAKAGDWATDLAWSASSARLFVSDASGALAAFDAQSGAEAWRVEAHPGGVLAIAGHPNARGLLSTGQDGAARLWEETSGALRREHALGASWGEHAAWSPDGARYAIAAGKRARVYREDGSEAFSCDDHASTVSGLAFCREQLGTSCYGAVAFWNAETGALEQRLSYKSSLLGLVISSDAKIAACATQESSVHFWRRTSGRDAEMSGYEVKPTALAFDARSRWLATGGGKQICVWDFSGRGPEGSRPLLLDLHQLPVSALRFANRKGLLASGGRDGGVGVWSIGQTGKARTAGAAVLSGAIERVAFSPDDRLLAAIDGDGNVAVWRQTAA